MAPKVTLARPRGFRKDHPCSSVTSPPPRLVVGRRHCPTLAPPSTHSSAVYRRLKRRLGLGLHCKRRFLPESHFHINFLGVKSSPSGPQEFRAFLQGPDCSCSNGQHNCSLLHQGGMRSGSLCTLLWRLLSSCHPRGISLRAQHIPGRLNVIADKLSRHNQLIQSECSLPQQVFNLLCLKWAQPHVDLFYNPVQPLPKFVSPVPDLTAWAVDAMSLSWANLDVYTFPPMSLLNQVISKVVDQGCRRMILIAPGWPNMPWFWD